jgi:hypothetical protein
MKIQQLLEHYGVRINPFSQEDAQSDHIFRHHCAASIYHPAWDKVLGDCENPSTSIVFGEKGSGKTAIRLQLVEAIRQYNRTHPDHRAFIISYDDLNPFLDNFRDRLRGRKRNPDLALKEWRLWDHMDALLTLSTRRLCNVIADPHASDQDFTVGEIKELPRLRKRDLLMLAAFYDQSSDQSHWKRWKQIKWRIGFMTPFVHWRIWLGGLVTLLVVMFSFRNFSEEGLSNLAVLKAWWFWLAIIAGWTPWATRFVALWWKARQVSRQVRILEHGTASLRRILHRFPVQELDGQPIPSRDRSDDRYELLSKLQRILTPLGFTSIIVLVDRVDEPHLINGSSERMKDFLWSMFDNKFLKHPGIGFKMLLPRDVVFFLNREEREFYERSRLDKQNLVNSLEWTGESLFDMASNRLRACLAEDSPNADLTIQSLFADDVSRDDIIAAFARLRVPRHRATEDDPSWKINRVVLESTMEAYSRELEALDRGLGTGG